MSITVSSLGKKYGQQWAVDHIDFSIKSGEIVGFLGPNGAGKSTTMKMITGYIPPTVGSIEVCGMDAVENSIEARRKIGYLPEHNPLYLDMYVLEYLDYAGGLSGVKDRKTAANKAIELTQLGPERHKKIGQLSKGYRQRVGLAQALIHNPEVLILDEPTSGLDPIQVMEMRSVIKNLGHEKTVLLSTHIMQEVEAMCSRVIIINKGSIVANGGIEQLRNNQSLNQITVKVEFSSSISETWFTEIPEVLTYSTISPTTFEIVGNTADLREKISRKAAEKGDVIIALQQEENSLENIFKTVTGHVGRI
ncbi:MAG: gliding motility-associated transporter ATP-binding subunit GldA [Bacteroidota bacterium]